MCLGCNLKSQTFSFPFLLLLLLLAWLFPAFRSPNNMFYSSAAAWLDMPKIARQAGLFVDCRRRTVFFCCCYSCYLIMWLDLLYVTTELELKLLLLAFLVLWLGWRAKFCLWMVKCEFVLTDEADKLKKSRNRNVSQGNTERGWRWMKPTLVTDCVPASTPEIYRSVEWEQRIQRTTLQHQLHTMLYV